MGQASSILSQSFFIPSPPLTIDTLPDQTGRVHIVTGGYAGVGKELARILYSRNATVYIAGRSSEKYNAALTDIQHAAPSSTGKLDFLQLDLSDLPTVSAAAAAFMAKESRLDVLYNNAGVMVPAAGSVTAQGHELQMGTNCLGPFLLSTALLPVLRSTAQTSPPGSVRVTWAGSIGVQVATPKYGVQLGPDGPEIDPNPWLNYGMSKAGNFFLGSEFARRYGREGIVSASFNPGNLRSELQRHMGWIGRAILLMGCYHAEFGAATELYAGCSPDIGLERNGVYVMPWGQIGTEKLRPDVLEAAKGKEEGGKGLASEFWDWCEKETRAYTISEKL
ncbi:short-chain dehydrogenase [Pseudovirgaria hyperparasitica]|uniref:Short-chain dehydrogenase n=1 Tax=Pseudovirgaria hyperparasitica TaxID=470096 RepID=A0A6A6WEH0_9PEZI|nr:short-chain dehydrogenase [Pseudovirgaria hyperparasitica]KAF2761113.1 short-chain dehydrogenase [Pseudovirgaria hyperparasitica]